MELVLVEVVFLLIAEVHVELVLVEVVFVLVLVV